VGADLYLTDIFEKQREKYEPKFTHWAEIRDALRQAGKRDAEAQAQKQVEKYFGKMHERGYFRDSYNNSNLLWLFDLNWWRDVGDRLLDKRYRMSPKNAMKLLQELQQREPIFEDNVQKVKPANGETPAEIIQYFRDKYKRLRAFLREAIDKKAYIECSV
jgi:DNA polymerase II small subunit/DNA polymerase delta subunit B